MCCVGANVGHMLLCSVLVHSGGVHGGHYYAFIRPTLSDQWCVLYFEFFVLASQYLNHEKIPYLTLP
jgi:uncharacterized UBP type Zn finger protein